MVSLGDTAISLLILQPVMGGGVRGKGGVLEPNPRTPGCSGEFGQKFLEA